MTSWETKKLFWFSNLSYAIHLWIWQVFKSQRINIAFLLSIINNRKLWLGLQSDWFPLHLLLFLKDTEKMRCICLHSLPQAFSNRIWSSAACFLFTTRNRKTRFPAFSIPNGLVLQGKTSPSEPTPRLQRKQEKQKLVHSFPKYSSGRQPRIAPALWFNILSFWRKR